MIYQLFTTELVPGKMSEYFDLAKKYEHPLYPKFGIKQVGSFRSYTGNMNQVYALFVYEDFPSLQKTREAQRQDPDFQKAAALQNAFRKSIVSTILEPNPWSPMK